MSECHFEQIFSSFFSPWWASKWDCVYESCVSNFKYKCVSVCVCVNILMRYSMSVCYLVKHHMNWKWRSSSVYYVILFPHNWYRLECSQIYVHSCKLWLENNWKNDSGNSYTELASEIPKTLRRHWSPLRFVTNAHHRTPNGYVYAQCTILNIPFNLSCKFTAFNFWTLKPGKALRLKKRMQSIMIKSAALYFFLSCNFSFHFSSFSYCYYWLIQQMTFCFSLPIFSQIIQSVCVWDRNYIMIIPHFNA